MQHNTAVTFSFLPSHSLSRSTEIPFGGKSAEPKTVASKKVLASGPISLIRQRSAGTINVNSHRGARQLASHVIARVNNLVYAFH